MQGPALTASASTTGYRTLPTGTLASPYVVATDGAESQVVITPRGTGARNLLVSGEEEVKKMTRVAQGGGDYVQVTTYRYVGHGGGEFNMVPESRDDGGCDAGGCGAWRLLCGAVLLLSALATVAWLCWPEDGFSELHSRSTKLWREPSTTTSPPSTENRGTGGIDVSMSLTGFNFEGLRSKKEAEAFSTAIREAVAFYVADGLSIDRVGVAVLPEGNVVHADLIPKCAVDVDKINAGLNFTSLARAVKANLETFGAFQASLKAPLTVRIINSAGFAAPCEGQAAQSALRAREAFRQTARTPQPSHQSKDCKLLTITGATSASKGQVNGVYVLQEASFNGKHLFRKKTSPDVWLAFMKARWYVTDTERKRDDRGGGWLYSAQSPNRPAEVETWQEWNGTRWKENAALQVKCEET